MRTKMFFCLITGLALAGLLVAMTGCQSSPDRSVTAPVPDSGADSGADKIAAGQTGYDNPVLHRELDEIWNGSDGILHQMTTGYINRDDGGSIVVTPSGWPAGYEVRLTVPAGVIPAGYPGGADILFGIAIPVESFESGGSPSYEFFPDGIVFDGFVEVTVCWPPWAGTPPSDSFDMVFLEADWHEMQMHYIVSDRLVATPAALQGPEPEGGWTLADRSTEITYHLNHFSRWGVTSGTDDGGDGTDVFLPGMDAEEGCWTMFTPDPDLPPLRLR